MGKFEILPWFGGKEESEMFIVDFDLTVRHHVFLIFLGLVLEFQCSMDAAQVIRDIPVFYQSEHATWFFFLIF